MTRWYLSINLTSLPNLRVKPPRRGTTGPYLYSLGSLVTEVITMFKPARLSRNTSTLDGIVVAYHIRLKHRRVTRLPYRRPLPSRYRLKMSSLKASAPPGGSDHLPVAVQQRVKISRGYGCSTSRSSTTSSSRSRYVHDFMVALYRHGSKPASSMTPSVVQRVTMRLYWWNWVFGPPMPGGRLETLAARVYLTDRHSPRM